MLTPLARVDIFRASAFIDNYIAKMQQAYAKTMDGNTYWEVKQLASYDHLEAFQKLERYKTCSSVIAYPASTKADYIAKLPQAFQHFLLKLGIEALYLLEFNQISLIDFPFENFRKKNAFKRMAKTKANSVGFKLEVGYLPKVLPLFFFSNRYYIAVITLLSANENMRLAIELCDDGNFHLSYDAKLKEKVVAAAQSVGLEVGDLSLCSKYYLHALS